jgi:hypothetical protein
VDENVAYGILLGRIVLVDLHGNIKIHSGKANSERLVGGPRRIIYRTI